MPRIKEDTVTLLADLTRRLGLLVRSAKKEGRETALGELRALVRGVEGVGRGAGGPAPAAEGGKRRGPGRPPKAAKAAKPGRKKRRGGPRKNPWASMTLEQRQDRVRKMLAGRGLKPKAER